MTPRTCDCDHGENDGPCGAPATKRHYCPWVDYVGQLRAYYRLCEPCNDNCHNRENERG